MGTIPKKTGFIERCRGAKVEKLAVIGGHTVPALLTFTFAQGATQYGTDCEVAVCNAEGQVIPGVHVLDLYLSDDAAGSGFTATDPFGTVTAKAASGFLFATHTAKKAFRVVTKDTGKFTLSIIDDSTPVLLYVAASIPCIGKVQVSRKTVAGDYKP